MKSKHYSRDDVGVLVKHPLSFAHEHQNYTSVDVGKKLT